MDFTDAWRAGRNLVFVVAVIIIIVFGALVKRISVQAHREWVAQCIISNVDYRPREGLRAYCESQYYIAKDAGNAP